MPRDESGFTVEPSRRVTRSPDALSAEVGDEVVLLNMATGYFHQLNVVGSYVWRALDEPRTIADLCRAAADDFEADDDDTCRRDIADFVRELHEAGLVRVE